MTLQRISNIIGKVVDGYQIEEVLGRGGMGIVYKAVDTSLDRVVALKVMNPLLVDNEQFFRRFKVEAKALGRLAHPNIVGVFTLRHTEDYLFIVMEYVDGGTLTDLIHQHEKIPWHNAIPIIEQTLSAVEYAHQQHVIHRDIKPSNILISRSGIAQVTDFGLAKIQNLSADTRGATKTGITGGTLYYMPPEQLAGLTKVDHRGDIYSLGMTYYVMLAGRSPFDKLSSEFEVLKAIDAHDFPALGELDTDIPEPLVQIIMKAVEREPEDRYQSAGEMLEAVRAWLASSSSEPSTGPATQILPLTQPPSRRQRKKQKRDTSSLLKTIITWLARTSSKAESHGTRVLQHANKEPVPTRAPVAPQPDIGAPPQGAPSPAGDNIDKTIIVSGEEPHTVRPLWKRRGFGVSLATVLLLAFLAYFLRQTPSVSTPEDDPVLVEASTAALSIHTDPEGGSVFINDQAVGETPLTDVAVKAGDLTLHIVKTGFLPLDTALAVTAGETPVFRFVLTPDLTAGVDPDTTQGRLNPDPPARVDPDTTQQTLGTLVVLSNPSGADVYLDNRRLGRTPYTARNVEAATYTVILRKSGHQDYETRLTIVPQQRKRLEADLIALMGTLRIVVRPFGTIHINDVFKASGFVPYTESFPYGTYRVRAEHQSYGRWEKSILLDQESEEVLFDFNQQFKVLVTSDPINAEIIVDGVSIGNNTPWRVTVRPGQHTFEVRKAGWVHESGAQSITVEGDRMDNGIHFTLTQER